MSGRGRPSNSRVKCIKCVSSLSRPWRCEHSVETCKEFPQRWELSGGSEMCRVCASQGKPFLQHNKFAKFKWFCFTLQDSKHIEGVVVKAESLFTMCRFEHAFALFSRVCRAKDSIAVNICCMPGSPIVPWNRWFEERCCKMQESNSQ